MELFPKTFQLPDNSFISCLFIVTVRNEFRMNSILIKNLNCHCCILVYDVTDEDSFNWFGKAIEKIYKISKDIRIMLIGNMRKYDRFRR